MRLVIAFLLQLFFVDFSHAIDISETCANECATFKKIQIGSPGPVQPRSLNSDENAYCPCGEYYEAKMEAIFKRQLERLKQYENQGSLRGSAGEQVVQRTGPRPTEMVPID